MKMIKGICVNTATNTIEVVEIEKSLDAYYSLIGCSCIDIVGRDIKGKLFAIVCDDEGTFVESPIVSALNVEGKPMLVGTLFIVNYDNVDSIESLTETDIEMLKSRFATALMKSGRELKVIILD